MKRKTKDKNDDAQWEKLARSCINEKIEYPIEAQQTQIYGAFHF